MGSEKPLPFIMASLKLKVFGVVGRRDVILPSW